MTSNYPPELDVPMQKQIELNFADLLAENLPCFSTGYASIPSYGGDLIGHATAFRPIRRVTHGDIFVRNLRGQPLKY